MIESVMGAGVQAVQRGQESATRAADRIARAGTTETANPDRELTTGAVELLQAEHLVKAGAKVIKTADEMVGSLFDDKA